MRIELASIAQRGNVRYCHSPLRHKLAKYKIQVLVLHKKFCTGVVRIYDTPLSPEQMLAYNQFLKESQRGMDETDYDLRGFFKGR